MGLINIGQTAVSSFRRQPGEQHKGAKIERRGSERRICADRRKEKRYGDVVERRQQANRRSD